MWESRASFQLLKELVEVYSSGKWTSASGPICVVFDFSLLVCELSLGCPFQQRSPLPFSPCPCIVSQATSTTPSCRLVSLLSHPFSISVWIRWNYQSCFQSNSVTNKPWLLYSITVQYSSHTSSCLRHTATPRNASAICAASSAFAIETGLELVTSFYIFREPTATFVAC